MSYGEVHIFCLCLDKLYINHISYTYINTSYYTPQPILEVIYNEIYTEIKNITTQNVMVKRKTEWSG